MMKKILKYYMKSLANLNIALIMFLVLGNSISFAQSSDSLNNFTNFKGAIDSLFHKISNAEISEKDAINQLSLLNTSPLSQAKVFQTVLKSILPSMIKGLNNLKDTTITYRVKKGDNLWGIADMYLRNALNWPRIFRINKVKIKNPDLIFPDQIIEIPITYEKRPSIIDSVSMAEMEKVRSVKKNQVIAPKVKKLDALDIEIDNLVVDETQSKIGKDFSDFFYKYWVPPLDITNYTITISEKPLPSLGSQITIELNDMVVFQRVIQPKYDTIDQSAKDGIQTVLAYLYNYQQVKENLEGEDLKGSGVF